MLPVFVWTHPSGETNFGDEINGVLVAALLGLRNVPLTRDPNTNPKLLAAGSVLADWFGRPGDAVWGSGSWGQAVPAGLDVRAVRGPLTADHLQRAGYQRPTVYGDPALLLPRYFPFPRGGNGIGYVPHHSDSWTLEAGLIDVRHPPLKVAAAIAACDLVVTSSLHGLIVGDAYNRPVVLVDGAEVALHPLKYVDYFASTGRDSPRPLQTYRDAHKAFAISPPSMLDLDALESAFPRDRMQRPS